MPLKLDIDSHIGVFTPSLWLIDWAKWGRAKKAPAPKNPRKSAYLAEIQAIKALNPCIRGRLAAVISQTHRRT
jgi:hypothetical protein